jgi:putative spermidine/putrescine transport system ATP-binding protein
MSYMIETSPAVAGQRLSLPDHPDALTDRELSFIIRPEKMFFVDESDSNRADVLPGRIEELIYVGDITRYRVRISDTESVIVKRQNRFGERQKAPGDECLVSWHVDDASLVSG